MRISYVGNFKPRHSTENHIAATLEDLGHSVIRLQEDEIDVLEIYRKTQAEADLFMYTRTWGLVSSGGCDGLWLMKQLKDAGIPTVSYHLDLYYGISRERSMIGDPFWSTEYVFTPDGGHAEEFKRDGINHFYLKPGVFKRECYKGIPQTRFKHDVIFVGSYEYHSEWYYRRELIDFLKATYGDRFMRYGHYAETVRNQDLNDLYASAKVVVGDSLCVGFKHPYYWSDRVYETLGRGGFLIHPEIKGLEEEFKTGEELVYYKFGQFAELRAAIDYYLEHDAEREAIRNRGHEFVKNNATYNERLLQMFEILRDQGAFNKVER